MITFPQFIEMLAAETGNHHAIINRQGKIIVVGPRGQFQYDTIADFARAHASSADSLSAVSQTASRQPNPTINPS